MADRDRQLVKSTAALIDEIVTEALCPTGVEFDAGGWKRTMQKRRYQWLWSEFDIARIESRRMFEGNEFAIGGTDCRIGYCVGDGFQYEFAAKDGRSPGTDDVKALNAWLADFLAAAVMDELEEETFLRNDRDGETFLRLFKGEENVPEVRFVEPERVRTPPGREEEKDETLGVITAPGDARSVTGYWVEPDVNEDAEEVPAEEVVHFKCNTDSAVRRGIPVYYPVFGNLNRCEDLLTSMSAIAKARAKVAILIQSAGLTRERGEEVMARLRQSTQTAAEGTARAVRIEELPYGAIVRANASEKWEFPTASVGAAELVSVLQADLRAVGSRLVMPEWMFTGLADQKYSNAFVVEAPTLKRFKRLQHFHAKRFGSWDGGPGRSSLIWKAARMSGLFEADVLDSVKVKVTTPSLESRDKATEASTNKTYVDMGVKDAQLVSEELGIDPDVAKRIAAEKAAKPAAPAMSATPPPAPNADGKPAPGDGTAPPADPNKPAEGTPPAKPSLPTGTGTASLLKLLGRTTEALDRITSRLADHPGWVTEADAGDLTEIGGELWTREALEWVMEGRDRSHLVRTRVRRKDGHWTWVYKKPAAAPARTDGGDGAGGDWGQVEDPNSPEAVAAEAERSAGIIRDILRDPSDHGEIGLETLADRLKSLKRGDIREIVRELDLKVGGTKRELADRLVAHAKRRMEPLDPADRLDRAGRPVEQPAAPETPPPRADIPTSVPVPTDKASVNARYAVYNAISDSGALALADAGMFGTGGRTALRPLAAAWQRAEKAGVTGEQFDRAVLELGQLGLVKPYLDREAVPHSVERGPNYWRVWPSGEPRESLFAEVGRELGEVATAAGRVARRIVRGIGSALGLAGRAAPVAPPPPVGLFAPEMTPAADRTFDRLSSGLRESKGLTVAQSRRYEEAARTVAAAIPPAGHERIAAHLTAAKFHGDRRTMSLEICADVAAAANGNSADLEWASDNRQLIESGRRAPFGGAFVNRSGNLHLDGPASAGQAGAFGTARASEEQVYAHEIGHVIDGPRMEYSQSREWRAAWNAEIAPAGAATAGKGAPLTVYAATKPHEGFAEFTRLLYGTGHRTADIERAFPQASAFFKARGLWPTRAALEGTARESLGGSLSRSDAMPELLAAMAGAAYLGDGDALDALSEIGSDPEAWAEFLADLWDAESWMAAKTKGKSGAKAIWSGGSPRRPLYGQRARKALERQAAVERGETPPESMRSRLERTKAEAGPAREVARAKWRDAVSDPSTVKPSDLPALGDHLKTLSREELADSLKGLALSPTGLKTDLVRRMLDHVREQIGEETPAAPAPVAGKPPVAPVDPKFDVVTRNAATDFRPVLDLMAPGTRAFVGGYDVTRNLTGSFAVQHGKITFDHGDSEKVAGIIKDGWQRQAWQARSVAAALQRAATHSDAIPMIEQERFDAEQRKADQIPEGAGAVSTAEGTYGRVGAVVKGPDGGRRLVFPDSPDELYSLDYEPLDIHNSWRAGDVPIKPVTRVAPVRRGLFDDLDKPKPADPAAKRPDGTPSSPRVEDVHTVPVASLKVDPARFQYKVSGIGEGGVGKELKGTSVWNPELGGTLLVWRDPADGSDYVVNGHHRFELATRTGAESVNARYISAKDARTARAKGALANIAEGRGTATDAAKYLRDTGADADHLRRAGVSMTGRIAADAAVLKDLGDRSFQRLAEGRLDESQAVAVARHLKDPALQDMLFGRLAKREEEGKDWTAREIEVAAKKVAHAGRVTKPGEGLFKDFESPEEHSTFDQEVELESHVGRLLSQEAHDFAAVSSARRAGTVAGAGNTLNLDENARRRDEAVSRAALFDQHANLVGPVSAAIRKHAAELALAKTKKEKERVRLETVESVRSALATL